MSDNKWIPVNERLPETDTDVLVWNGKRNRMDVASWLERREYWYWHGIGLPIRNITHWQPLPALPVAE